MSEPLLKFLVGIAILLFSTQKLVKLAEKLSRLARISPLIIGITVVALGTSLPEMVVSIVSAIKGDVGLAMGNIIGSNIINVLMVFPVGIFMGRLRIGTTKTQRNVMILLGATFFFFLTQSGMIPRVASGLLLIGLALAISLWEYYLGILGRNHEDLKQTKVLKKDAWGPRTAILVPLLLLGMIAGGWWVVESIETISLLSGISTTVLGLTLTAIATSLPELLTTIFSQEDHQEKLTVGNIIGSNLYNLLLIGGGLMLFPVATVVSSKEWWWLASTTLVFAWILKQSSGRRPSKWIGVILLSFFLIFIFSQ